MKLNLITNKSLPRYEPLVGWRKFFPWFFDRRFFAFVVPSSQAVYCHPKSADVVRIALQANGYEVVAPLAEVKAIK